MARRPRKTAPLPTEEQILAFIDESPAPVGRREIARAFGMTGGGRTTLKRILDKMATDGLIEGRRRRARARARSLPAVTVIEIVEVDTDGELLARPVSWHGPDAAPRIIMAPGGGHAPALGVGDRVLARIARIDQGLYEGRAIKRLPAAPRRVLGVYTAISGSGRIVPTDKRQKQEFVVAPGDVGGANRGELVVAEVLPARHLGLRQARVLERLGQVGSSGSLSLIAIHGHGIPTSFTEEALAEAEGARVVSLGKRADLREIPLITIDPEDARDHDDAVWAQPDRDPGNEGGWQVIVAIADVGHYVPPDSALDRCASERGNSVYFPDRVVPMLPEALSNALCSLKPGEARPVLAVRMRFDKDGTKLSHEFVRGLMRSAAALTYSQVQAAADGDADEATRPLLEPVIRPLYEAYGALGRSAKSRQRLEIEVPEREVVFDEAGGIAQIRVRDRLQSHRLIEEFMIAANACAAETLERRKRPCMYRVHEPPQEEQLSALRDALAALGYPLAMGRAPKPANFNRVIASAQGTSEAWLVSEVILRAQSQAFYSPENLGHFGLGLGRYAHFTSPIRRYADLLVHRALIDALGLGDGGLAKRAGESFAEIGERISAAARRAQAAERDAMDRFTAAYLADAVGASFSGHISGVSRFGLFVTLSDTGADGLVPIGSLADDYYRHDEARHSLVGRRLGKLYRLGDRVDARLVEADPITGRLRLELLEDRTILAARGTAGVRKPRGAARKERRRRQGPATSRK